MTPQQRQLVINQLRARQSAAKNITPKQPISIQPQQSQDGEHNDFPILGGIGSALGNIGRFTDQVPVLGGVKQGAGEVLNQIYTKPVSALGSFTGTVAGDIGNVIAQGGANLGADIGLLPKVVKSNNFNLQNPFQNAYSAYNDPNQGKYLGDVAGSNLDNSTFSNILKGGANIYNQIASDPLTYAGVGAADKAYHALGAGTKFAPLLKPLDVALNFPRYIGTSYDALKGAKAVNEVSKIADATKAVNGVSDVFDALKPENVIKNTPDTQPAFLKVRQENYRVIAPDERNTIHDFRDYVASGQYRKNPDKALEAEASRIAESKGINIDLKSNVEPIKQLSQKLGDTMATIYDKNPNIAYLKGNMSDKTGFSKIIDENTLPNELQSFVKEAKNIKAGKYADNNTIIGKLSDLVSNDVKSSPDLVTSKRIFDKIERDHGLQIGNLIDSVNNPDKVVIFEQNGKQKINLIKDYGNGIYNIVGGERINGHYLITHFETPDPKYVEGLLKRGKVYDFSGGAAHPTLATSSLDAASQRSRAKLSGVRDNQDIIPPNQANLIANKDLADLPQVYTKYADSRNYAQQITDAKMAVQKMFGGKIKLKPEDIIFTPDEGTALGQFRDAIINIERGNVNALNITLHESVHAGLRAFINKLNPEEYKNILESIVNKYGEENLLKEYASRYGTDINTIAEEKMADMFVEYYRTHQGVTGRLKEIFDAIVEWLGKENKQNSFYRDLNQGKFAKSDRYNTLLNEALNKSSSFLKKNKQKVEYLDNSKTYVKQVKTPKTIEDWYNNKIYDEVQNLKREIKDGGLETHFIPNQDNYDLTKTVDSLNEKWYKDFWDREGRKPRNADLIEIAKERLANGYTTSFGEIPQDTEFALVHDMMTNPSDYSKADIQTVTDELLPKPEVKQSQVVVNKQPDVQRPPMISKNPIDPATLDIRNNRANVANDYPQGSPTRQRNAMDFSQATMKGIDTKVQYAEPIKRLGLLRTYVGRIRNNIATMGKNGQQLANDLSNWRNESELLTTKWVNSMPTVKNLNKDEFTAFVDMAEGKTSTLSLTPEQMRKVNQAVSEWDLVRKNVYNQARGSGLNIGEVKNYFPHSYDKAIFTDRNKYQRAIQHLLDTGQASNEKQARELLNGLDETIRNRKFGNLELERKANLPDYKKTKEVLYNYLSNAADRIKQVQVFGKHDSNAMVLLQGMANDGYDATKAKNFFDIAVGAKQYDSDAQKVSSAIRTISNVTKLGLSAISNMSQSINTATVAGVGNTVKSMAKYFTDKETRQFVESTGTILDTVLKDIRNGSGFTQNVIGKISSPFFNNVERFNRAVAGAAGKSYAEQMAKKAFEGDKTGIIALNKLGLNAQAVIARKGVLNESEKIIAARKVVERTQFKVDPQDLPAWTDSPMGKVVTQFRSFSYNQTAFMVREVLSPLKQGNIKPLLTFSVFGLGAGAGVTELQNLLRNRPSEQDPIKRVFSYAQRVGAFGLPGDIVSNFIPQNSVYMPADRVATRAAGTFFGPGISTVMDLAGSAGVGLQDVQAGRDPKALERFALKNIPLVGQTVKNTVLPYNEKSGGSSVSYTASTGSRISNPKITTSSKYKGVRLSTVQRMKIINELKKRKSIKR